LFFDHLERCPLTAASQPGEKEDELCVGHQARLPVEQAVLSLKRAAWSFRVLPNVVGTFKSTPDDQYPEPPACRIGTAAASVIFHLPFSPLSHRYRAWKCWDIGKKRLEHINR